MNEESLLRMERYGSTTRNIAIAEEISRRVEKIRSEENSAFNQGQIKSLQDLFDFIHNA